uniref:Phosphatidylinositol glycan anchor biosynthesis class H n=1 Tax=Cyanistes caeruleus TaxID=156563 RepID=A0A8C0V0Y5_CYACU
RLHYESVIRSLIGKDGSCLSRVFYKSIQCSQWLPLPSCLPLHNSMVLSAAIFITLIGLIIYLHFVKIDQESLLVIGSLGIQVTSSYASGKESTTFIEMGQVKDVVINEAIHMQKVIYYLCILLQDPEDPQGVSEVVPLFQSSQPRLDCLIEVYKSCQEILEQRKTAPQSSEIK